MNICYWDQPQDIDRILPAIFAGHVVAGTGDTVFGLLALASKEGRAALDALKGRSEKPYILLISSIDKIALFSDQVLSENVKKLLAAAWPGPLTIIVRARPDLDQALTSAARTIALRVPKHAGLQAILCQVPALFSTSANLAGQKPPEHFKDLAPSIAQRLEMCVIDEKESATLPSTILDLSTDEPLLVRSGAYDVGDLAQFGLQLKKI